MQRKLLYKLQAKFCFSHQPNFSYKTTKQAAVYDDDITSKQPEMNLENSTCYNNKGPKVTNIFYIYYQLQKQATYSRHSAALLQTRY